MRGTTISSSVCNSINRRLRAQSGMSEIAPDKSSSVDLGIIVVPRGVAGPPVSFRGNARG